MSEHRSVHVASQTVEQKAASEPASATQLLVHWAAVGIDDERQLVSPGKQCSPRREPASLQLAPHLRLHTIAVR
jgi:hypothetical protein